MSLSNPNDMIIPNTTGLITAMRIEANQFSTESKLKPFIDGVSQVYDIINGRVAGNPLNTLVNPSRISDEEERIKATQQNDTTNKRVSVYESWFQED